MEIKILTVGKIKEKYLNDGIAEYAKRLSRYCKLTFCQVADEKTPDKASDALNQQIKETDTVSLKKIVILLVIIISVGISSTYRVIVIKRNVESGTLRALGMKPSGIMRMFVTEGFVLLLSGSIVGFICSLLIVNVAKIFNLSFITGFDLFLTGGCLAPSCNLVKIVLFVSVIIVTTLLSVLFTLRKLVHVSPVGAITSTN